MKFNKSVIVGLAVVAGLLGLSSARTVQAALETCWCADSMGVCTILPINPNTQAECDAKCQTAVTGGSGAGGWHSIHWDASGTDYSKTAECKPLPDCWCANSKNNCVKIPAGKVICDASLLGCDAQCPQQSANGEAMKAIHCDNSGTDYSKTAACAGAGSEGSSCSGGTDQKALADFLKAENAQASAMTCKTMSGQFTENATVAKCLKSNTCTGPNAMCCLPGGGAISEPGAGGTPQQPLPPTSAELYNPLGEVNTVYALASRVIKSFIGILGAVALVMFVIGGIVWMSAGGAEKRVTLGRMMIINAAIGIVLAFLSYSLVSVFLSALGGLGGGAAQTQTKK